MRDLLIPVGKLRLMGILGVDNFDVLECVDFSNVKYLVNRCIGRIVCRVEIMDISVWQNQNVTYTTLAVAIQTTVLHVISVVKQTHHFFCKFNVYASLNLI